jgi:basic membrane protein A
MIGTRGCLAAVAVSVLILVPAAAATPRAPFTVCLVVGSGLGSTLDPSARAGLRDVERSGVRGIVRRTTGATDDQAALAACLADGADLTLAVGEELANAVDAVASANPSRRFALIDVSEAQLAHRPGNVTGVMFLNEESGYLAGYAAAQWAKARTRHGDVVVGSVGGLDTPPADRYIAGFEFGARKAVPDVTVLRRFAQSEFDPDACRRTAASELASGAKVVLAVAGACSPGVLAAAGPRGALTIMANDPGAGRVAPTLLTSVVEHADVAIRRVVGAARLHRLRGGRDVWFGVRVGAVGYGAWGPRVPRSIRRAVAAQLRLLEAGDAPAIPATFR